LPDYPTIERGLDWLLDQEILTERQVNRLAGDLGTRVAIETATLHSAFDDLLRGQLAESFARSEGRDAWRDRLSKTLPGLLNHAEAIGRTYSHRAYQQGLDEVLSESKVAADEFPYDLYQATGDSRTRETHRELDDKVAHRGSPLAKLMRERHAEWGCRCTIVPISREEALSRGIDDDTGWVEPEKPAKPLAEVDPPKDIDLSHIDYKRSEIADTLKRVDASLSIDDLPGLVGAPDGSKVNLSIPASNEIKINLYDPETGYKSRRVLKTYNGKLILKNEESELPKAKQGKGISTDIFAKQVKAAEAAGVDEIWAVAAKADDLNGYYTWARLGFDSPLSPRFKATLPPEFASAETVQDLMATEAGRDYWRANGYQTGMIFSVKPGSRNREIFERYLRTKGRQV
jgi:hypothetical protein